MAAQSPAGPSAPHIAAQLHLAAQALAHSPSARLDAELLLAHVTGHSRALLRAHPERELPPDSVAAYAALVEARAQGVPMAYLTGTQEFWSLPLRVTRDTLIPRADTERLVEAALETLPADRDAALADLGTGTGAIAIALARERPRARVVATERAPGALAVAAHNIAQLAPGRVELRAAASDGWFDPLGAERYDMLVSNPPYIAAGDAHLALDGVRYEPHAALVAGPQGLDDLREIVHGAATHLREDGWLMLEHGFDQGDAVQALLRAIAYRDVATLEDLGGQPRVTRGRRPLA